MARLRRFMAATALAGALGAALPVSAQIYFDERAHNQPVRSVPSTAERQNLLSPLDPLDAPDAYNVWKPSNRDAGNLAEQRWAEYTAQRQQAARAELAEAPPRKPEPWNRYPHYDSLGEFFATVFH
jgi:hypothetical protein